MTGALPDVSMNAPTQGHPLLVLQLCGSQEEMGHQHGTLLRAAGGWQEAVDFYPNMPSRTLLKGGPDNRVAALAQNALSRPILELALARLERKRPAELRNRSRAFMRALGKPAHLSRYGQVMDLLQNVIGQAARFGLGPFAKRTGGHLPPACSSLVVWGESSADGQLRHARNFDFPGIGLWEKAPAIVFCSPDDGGLRYGFITTRGADTPGVSAFNEAGLTLTAHTRFHRDVNWHGRAIVDLGHEIVRRAETLEDALRIARMAPIASSWGLCISSAREKRAVVLETSGRIVEAVEPGVGESFMACTNRYRHPAITPGEVTISPAFIANSDGREAMLRNAAQRGALSLQLLQDLLGSHEQADAPGERACGSVLAQCMSVKSIVVEPELERVQVSVGAAPTGKGPWLTVPWHWEDNVGLQIMKLDEALPQPISRTSRFSGNSATAKGYAAYLEAARIDGEGGDLEQVAAHVERASALDPEEPSYRFLSGAFRLKKGDARGAIEQFEAGLAVEEAPFYRGQFLLWASRAADAVGDSASANTYRDALLVSDHPLLETHREFARSERLSAFPTQKMRNLNVFLHFMDAA